MADEQTEIQALQAIVTGLSAQSYGHRIQGLVFGSKGLAALADKYAAHAEEEGIAQVANMMPIFAEDLVAYEDMKAYLIDEDEDLQETNQDLELIELVGLQDWLVMKLNGAETEEE